MVVCSGEIFNIEDHALACERGGSSLRVFNSFFSHSSALSFYHHRSLFLSFFHRLSLSSPFLSLSLCRGIGSQSSVYVRSYEIPRRTVSAVIEYFYTAEFNSGPPLTSESVNGGERLGSVSRMKSSPCRHKFGREERRVYPNNEDREASGKSARRNSRLRIMEYIVNNAVCCSHDESHDE